MNVSQAYSATVAPHRHLPRLTAAAYQRNAIIHWSMTLHDRATGWLDPLFHARFREVLLHTLVRHDLFCPAYCLMPDHLHLLWMGVAPTSDQLPAARFFRRELNALLAPRKLQNQGFDHALREQDRERGAFQKIVFYILANPVRSGLATTAAEYPFSGALIPGYPALDVTKETYWDLFWRLYDAALKRSDWRDEATVGRTLTSAATESAVPHVAELVRARHTKTETESRTT